MIIVGLALLLHLPPMFEIICTLSPPITDVSGQISWELLKVPGTRSGGISPRTDARTRTLTDQ